MENKKKVKVKSFIRKGKIVKSYNRNQEIRNKILTGLGGAVIGAGLLGTGVLIGKGKSPKIVQQVSNADDIARQVISKIPKQKDINVDEIVEAVSKKVNQQKANTDEIVSEILKKIPKQQSTSSSSSSITGNILEEIPIRKVKLPARIDGLSKIKIENLTKNAQKATNEQLDKTISKLSSNLSKYQESLTDVIKTDELNTYLDNLKPEKLKQLGRDESYVKMIKSNIVNDVAKYLKLPIETTKDIDDLVANNTRFNIDKEYRNNLKKLINRKKTELDIYQSELSKRNKKDIESASSESIDRMKDLLDDFSLNNNYINFNQMFFLNDVNANFARKVGSKDKKKRIVRNALIGLGVAGAGLGSAYLLRRNVNKDMQKLNKVVNNANNTTQKLKNDFDEINQNIKAYNSTANKNPITTNSNITNINDLNSFMTSKPKKRRFTTSTGYVSKNINRKQVIGVKKAKKSKTNSLENINVVKRKLNNEY